MPRPKAGSRRIDEIADLGVVDMGKRPMGEITVALQATQGLLAGFSPAAAGDLRFSGRIAPETLPKTPRDARASCRRPSGARIVKTVFSTSPERVTLNDFRNSPSSLSS